MWKRRRRREKSSEEVMHRVIEVVFVADATRALKNQQQATRIQLWPTYSTLAVAIRLTLAATILFLLKQQHQQGANFVQMAECHEFVHDLFAHANMLHLTSDATTSRLAAELISNNNDNDDELSKTISNGELQATNLVPLLPPSTNNEQSVVSKARATSVQQATNATSSDVSVDVEQQGARSALIRPDSFGEQAEPSELDQQRVAPLVSVSGTSANSNSNNNNNSKSVSGLDSHSTTTTTTFELTNEKLSPQELGDKFILNTKVNVERDEMMNNQTTNDKRPPTSWNQRKRRPKLKKNRKQAKKKLLSSSVNPSQMASLQEGHKMVTYKMSHSSRPNKQAQYLSAQYYLSRAKENNHLSMQPIALQENYNYYLTKNNNNNNRQPESLHLNMNHYHSPQGPFELEQLQATPSSVLGKFAAYEHSQRASLSGSESQPLTNSEVPTNFEEEAADNNNNLEGNSSTNEQDVVGENDTDYNYEDDTSATNANNPDDMPPFGGGLQMVDESTAPTKPQDQQQTNDTLGETNLTSQFTVLGNNASVAQQKVFEQMSGVGENNSTTTTTTSVVEEKIPNNMMNNNSTNSNKWRSERGDSGAAFSVPANSQLVDSSSGGQASDGTSVSEVQMPSKQRQVSSAAAGNELLVGPFKSEAEAPATITLAGVVYQKSGASSALIRSAFVGGAGGGGGSGVARLAPAKSVRQPLVEWTPSSLGAYNPGTGSSSSSYLASSANGNILLGTSGTPLTPNNNEQQATGLSFVVPSSGRQPLVSQSSGELSSLSSTNSKATANIAEQQQQQQQIAQQQAAVDLLNAPGGATYQKQTLPQSAIWSLATLKQPLPASLQVSSLNNLINMQQQQHNLNNLLQSSSTSSIKQQLDTVAGAQSELNQAAAAVAVAASESKGHEHKASPVVIVQKDVKPVKYHLLRAYLKLRRLLRPFEATYVFPNDGTSGSFLKRRRRRRLAHAQMR